MGYGGHFKRCPVLALTLNLRCKKAGAAVIIYLRTVLHRRDDEAQQEVNVLKGHTDKKQTDKHTIQGFFKF